VFDAITGGVIHQAILPPGSVRISPKPEAVTVTPLIVVEDPKPGKALTVAHIGQTGVGVGVGVTVFVGVTVGVTIGQI
jgi:hypothetical protein